MTWSARTITAAQALPLLIGIDEACRHVEEDRDDYRPMVESALRAATDHVERITGQVLTERDCVLIGGGFPVLPEMITIPRTPVIDVVKIEYVDADGVDAVLLDYRWDEHMAEVVRPRFGAQWPRAAREHGSVRVFFEAGYGEGLAPPSLIAAVKLLTGHFYANRESVVTGVNATELPNGVAALVHPYRRMTGL